LLQAEIIPRKQHSALGSQPGTRIAKIAEIAKSEF
jgi:hypothetical protein